MTRDMTLGFARHMLTFGGGFLVTKGMVDAALLDQAIGALITLGGVIWSIFDKKSR